MAATTAGPPASQLGYAPGDDAAVFVFPPFPSAPRLVPFDQWSNPGVCFTKGEPSRAVCDTRGTPVSCIQPTAEAVVAAEKRAAAPGGPSRGKIARDDCWKVGELGTDWVEPGWTYNRSKDIEDPPFSRVMDAMRAFYESRVFELQTYRNSILYGHMRSAFGLRVEMAGDHWPGHGPHGRAYQRSNVATRNAYQPEPMFEGDIPPDDEWQAARLKAMNGHDEACALLKHPETAVRGLLAMARKEMEATWDTAPALKLAAITSAFLSFIEYHDILSDPHIKPAISRAAAIARTAVPRIRNAHMLEEALDAPLSWNGSAWSTLGGSYGRPGVAPETTDVVDEDDGGWGMPRAGLDVSLDAARPSEVEVGRSFAALCKPVEVHAFRMVGYVPYQRRKVIDVLPPIDGSPRFKSKLFRLVTVAAPWTPEERWRVSTSLKNKDNKDVADPLPAGSKVEYARNWLNVPFEKEEATIEPPEQLAIWVEDHGLGLDTDAGKANVVGAGLRGRWAAIAGGDDEHVWIFKAKDYVLPAFWQSDLAAATAIRNDPFPIFPPRN